MPAATQPQGAKSTNAAQEQIDKMDEERLFVDDVNRVMDFMTEAEKQEFADTARGSIKGLQYEINRNSLEALLADYPEPEEAESK